MFVLLGYRGADGGSDGVSSIFEVKDGSIINRSCNWRADYRCSREGYYSFRIFGYMMTLTLDRKAKKVPFNQIASTEGSEVGPGTLVNYTIQNPSGWFAQFGYAYIFE